MTARRIVHQESVRYQAPPPFTFTTAPAGLEGVERAAWYAREYAAYPEWLALYLRGGFEFGGLHEGQLAIETLSEGQDH